VHAPHFPLVPRTQRSVTSTVRCRAGAHAVESKPRDVGAGSAQQR